jgi:hypothetical protein
MVRPNCLQQDTATLQQRYGVDTHFLGNPLQALERQVPLAPLDASHVGPVDAQHLGERLLAEAASLAVGPRFSPTARCSATAG